jgi:hypothetical protein
MPTNRTPRPRKRHRSNIAVTSEAVETYARARELERKGFGKSREYIELARQLDEMFNLKPWQPNPLHKLGDAPPAGVPKSLEFYWHEVVAIQKTLDAALVRRTEPIPPSPRVVPLRPEQPAP